ncbi:MAG: outer membrane protein assembly factor BamA [Bacteroidia bacterium]|nr:outer membrane protein assembly factor BamA [Bacteroidia bacterium]NNC86735.1 outer membrane protein assembly factor BamA [Bacteroidia bacterium]NNM15635.1 outer membrane protein assembly factor BamA [Bacteroidia bacterium]
MLKHSLLLILTVFLFLPLQSWAQIQIGGDDVKIDFANPQEYEIGGLTVSGIQHLDANALKAISGLRVGDRINVPGDEISDAINQLWKQGILSDIKIVATNIQGNLIFLDLQLTERPRLTKFSFKGVSKTEADNLRDNISLVTGKIITDNLKQVTKAKIVDFFIEKGYLNAEVSIEEKDDEKMVNGKWFVITVDKKNKIKINDIIVHGNTEFEEKKLLKSMKGTKEKKFYRLFSTSKFLESEYTVDKKSLITKYNTLGFRDAHIVKDSIYAFDDKTINIEITVDEGDKYYFRNITWVGNTKYSSDQLSTILNIKRGEVYNESRLESALYMNPTGRDVTSLYMDDGYLFFQITPVEILVEGDSIDIEMRLLEGKQARVNKVTVVGNTKTSDKVIMREIRTQPGQLFSRADIIRTQRELAQLNLFNPEAMGVNPTPNPQDGTVDIEYVVEERPSDQVELSGGYGANQLVGTLGLTFSNFSTRKMFTEGGSAWNPLPSGDGQLLSLRAQSNGRFFTSYNLSFTEPWLGGKKPHSFTFSTYRSRQNQNGREKDDPLLSEIVIFGSSVGIGFRLKKPDDFFSVYGQIGYQLYKLQNFNNTFLFSDGTANNLSLTGTLQRNSIDAPLYPTRGSQFSMSFQTTLPWSQWFDGKTDYAELEPEDRYKWIEYHKWKFNSKWFMNLSSPKAERKFVLSARAEFGFLGLFNQDIGQSPFERFYVGGDGLSGFSLDGREIIALRGYENQSLTPTNSNGSRIGGTVYNKYTLELRYPFSTNPTATIYGLTFLEGGNSWLDFNDYTPFNIKRSAGFGVRIFLPMFGLLGLDYGYGYDDILNNANANKGQVHFSIGQSF